ncbi:MAG: C13 family peptidase [Betaproteobacteria bacterium]
MDTDLPDAGPPRVTAWSAFTQNLAAGLRIAFFFRVRGANIRASAGQFVVIAIASILVSFAAAVLLTGPDGRFDLQALPTETAWIPLSLFAGYLSARSTGDARYGLLIPVVVGVVGVALSVFSTAIWFAVGRGWLGDLTLQISAFDLELYPILFSWWALAVWLGVRRLTPRGTGRAIAPSWIVALLIILPAYFLPPDPLWIGEEVKESEPHAEFSEEALYAQADLLREAERRLKPERPGVEDLYFVAFAPYAGQNVFMKETQSIGKLMEERFDTAGRSILLISHPGLLDRYPIATLTSLRDALQAVGERINPEEDVVMLHLTSHGSQTHELSVSFPPLDLQSIRPMDLRLALDEAHIKWRIIVVSACYSGGFIDALRDAHTLVVTASDAQHTSFGCGNLFDFTYFSQAYYDDALRKTHNFQEAFAFATESILRREAKEGLEASNPQMYMGAAMKEKLLRLQKRLDAEGAREK